MSWGHARPHNNTIMLVVALTTVTGVVMPCNIRIHDVIKSGQETLLESYHGCRGAEDPM